MTYDNNKAVDIALRGLKPTDSLSRNKANQAAIDLVDELEKLLQDPRLQITPYAFRRSGPVTKFVSTSGSIELAPSPDGIRVDRGEGPEWAPVTYDFFLGKFIGERDEDDVPEDGLVALVRYLVT